MSHSSDEEINEENNVNLADDDTIVFFTAHPVAKSWYSKRKPHALGLAGVFLFILVVIGLVIVISSKKPLSPITTNITEVRLSNFVSPLEYHMKIDVFAEPRWVFNGTSKISVQVASPTNRVVLHASQMDITTMFFEVSGVIYKSGKYWMEEANEFLILESSELASVTSGASTKTPAVVTLHIEFTAPITTFLRGFYRSSYIENNETEEWIMVTDFEPAKARQAFPCFDEPEMKAIFFIELVVPPTYTAISNMPGSMKQESNERNTYTFQPTKLISTYLICYSVNKFTSIENSAGDILVRIWSQPSKIKQIEYALTVATSIVGNYSVFYDIAYPLPKLDLIAIPNFGAGAMENWGLITFRESALLYDPTQSSISDKIWVASVICHELAHQWFGNLVTMKWWDDLWLNEGFATFVEYIGQNMVEPDWNIWQLFSARDLQAALDLDSLNSSHPISANVTRPEEVVELFDAISYEKGGSILRMLQAYLNMKVPGSFQKGINDYLKKYKYSNAQTSDLWNSLSASSGISVNRLMDTWVNQKGYPLVTVKQLDVNSYKISQQRFLLVHNSNNNNTCTNGCNVSTDPVWHIPIIFRAGNGRNAILELKTASMEFTMNTEDMIIFNSGAFGFFRVEYPPKLRERIRRALGNDVNSLAVEDRTVYISDMFALEKSQKMTTVDILQNIQFLKKEKNLIVWSVALSWLKSTLQKIEVTIPLQYKYKDYVLALMNDPLSSMNLTINQKDFVDSLYKGSIFQVASEFGHRPSIDSALQLFEALKSKNQPVPSDLKSFVYKIAVKYGPSSNYFYVLNLYKNSSIVAGERAVCLDALGWTDDPALIQNTLEIALDPSVIKIQDMAILIGSVGSHSTLHRYLAWDFFKSNLKKILSINNGSISALSRIINGIVRGFTSQEKYDEIREFFNANPISEAKSAVTQALEQIQNKVEWNMFNGHTLEKFLQQYGKQ